jgi:hypothetical protein
MKIYRAAPDETHRYYRRADVLEQRNFELLNTEILNWVMNLWGPIPDESAAHFRMEIYRGQGLRDPKVARLGSWSQRVIVAREV